MDVWRPRGRGLSPRFWPLAAFDRGTDGPPEPHGQGVSRVRYLMIEVLKAGRFRALPDQPRIEGTLPALYVRVKICSLIIPGLEYRDTLGFL